VPDTRTSWSDWGLAVSTAACIGTGEPTVEPTARRREGADQRSAVSPMVDADRHCMTHRPWETGSHVSPDAILVAAAGGFGPVSTRWHACASLSGKIRQEVR
jgi:hypothetical protein